MIKVEPVRLSEYGQNQIIDWVRMAQRTVVVRVVKSHIAQLEARAANLVMDQALPFLIKSEVPDGTKLDLMEAAQWRIFLDKLNELTTGPFKLQLWKVSVDVPPSKDESELMQ